MIQRKVANGYRAMRAAEGEVAARTVVDTSCLRPGAADVFAAILGTISA